ncbi:hypothetical protein [Zavarzinia sp. CC-PAN008]|uniref:hypothetical protein n=1 Tax=Zavarzinia sp. CC-PAN008 TaxID=3243332 RepID=UPI003F743CAC
MEQAIQAFFTRYQDLVNRALAGEGVVHDLRPMFAEATIAATPQGVTTARNDADLGRAMQDGHARYRAIGTRSMVIRFVAVQPIDAMHAQAQVGWTAAYARPGRPNLPLDFDVTYFLQMRGGPPRIFGWVSGDEEGLLRQHGIIA